MLSSSLILAVATALLSGQSEAQYLNTTNKGPGYIKYSTVTGYFLQDEPDTVASGFDYVCCFLGSYRRAKLTQRCRLRSTLVLSTRHTLAMALETLLNGSGSLRSWTR